jgi:hypothetical protein
LPMVMAEAAAQRAAVVVSRQAAEEATPLRPPGKGKDKHARVVLDDDEASSNKDEPMLKWLRLSSVIDGSSGSAPATPDVAAAMKVAAHKEATDKRTVEAATVKRVVEEAAVKAAADKEAADKRAVEEVVVKRVVEEATVKAATDKQAVDKRAAEEAVVTRAAEEATVKATTDKESTDKRTADEAAVKDAAMGAAEDSLAPSQAPCSGIGAKRAAALSDSTLPSK